MYKNISIILILLTLLGCKKQTNTETSDNILETPSFNEKINAYIAVGNYMIGDYKGSSFSKATENFITIFGDKNQLKTDQEITSTWLGNNYNWGIKMAVDPALKINNEAPIITKLDSLELVLLNQIKSTNQKIDAFLAYYNQKEFLNDEFKLAKKLHPEIIDAIDLTYEKYYSASQELNIWIKKRDAFNLIALKESQQINYNLKFALLNAESILNEIENQEINNENITQLDVTKLNPFLIKLKECSASLATLTSNEDELRKSNINTQSTLNSFKSDLDKFIGQMNILNGKIKKQEGFSQKEIEYLNTKDILNRTNEIDGSINILFNLYNKIVDDYNYIM